MMINKIHAASGGIPARINELAQRVLLDRNLDGKERQTGAGSAAMRGTQMRRSLAMVAGAVVIALLLAGPLRSILFKPAPLAPAVPRQAESLSPPASNGGEEPRVIRLEESAAVPAPAPSPEADTATSATQDVKSLPLPPISPPPEAPAVVMEPVQPAAAPVPQAEIPAVASPVKELAKPEDLKPQATKPKAPASQALGNGIRGEEWVRAQPAGQFTLQLMALKEEKAARQFIETHHLQDKSAYYPIQRNGQILYALVYGVYPSQGEALQAAKDLPASWRVSNPWVRSFKSLRGEINP
jgi:DamX protein